jgi:hypothetical protein
VDDNLVMSERERLSRVSNTLLFNVASVW